MDGFGLEVDDPDFEESDFEDPESEEPDVDVEPGVEGVFEAAESDPPLAGALADAAERLSVR